jgi:hypothetical protein
LYLIRDESGQRRVVDSGAANEHESLGAFSWRQRRLGLAIVGGDLIVDVWPSRSTLCVGV